VLWKLAGADAKTLGAMELVFGNIANNAGHVMLGRVVAMGSTTRCMEASHMTYDVKEWHELLKASIGEDAYYERMKKQCKQMAKARAALADFDWDDVEYYYMINFFTDSALWAGGKAMAMEDTPAAFERAKEAAEANAAEKAAKAKVGSNHGPGIDIWPAGTRIWCPIQTDLAAIC
jgi:hypothetical protein